MTKACRVSIKSQPGADNFMYGSSTSNYLQWDASANRLQTVGTGNSIHIGSQANTKGSGTAISSSIGGALRVFCDDNGASIADSVRGIQSRFLLTYDQAAGTIRALQGQLKMATGVDVTTGIYTAVQGYIEMAGTHVAKTGSTFSCFDASAEIGTALTVDSGGEFFGVHIETTGAGTLTNNGTSAAIGVTQASGAADWPWAMYVQGAAVSNGIQLGTSTAPITLAAASNRGLEIQTTCPNTSTEADAVLINAVYTGVAGIDVALRVNMETNVKLGTWANAVYFSLDLKTAGGTAGLATVACAELTMGAGATEGTFGVFEGEINCPTSWTGTGPVSFFYLNTYGATKANFDTYGYLFTITGVSSGSGNFWYDHQGTAPANTEEWLRIKTPAGDRYLAVYNAVV